MQYLDFEVEIGHRLEPRTSLRKPLYPVLVLHSPEGAGEPRGEMTLPFTEKDQELQLAKLQNVLLRAGSAGTTMRRIASVDEKPVQEFGKTLFGALFTGEIGSCLEFAQRTAEKQGCGLRLKLRIQSPELAVLPWEFLYDGKGTGNFLALSPGTPLVRYVEVPRVISTLSVQPPLKILAVVASPTDLPTLNVDLERDRLEAALSGLIKDGRVELTWLRGQTWQHLREAMWDGPWHILHFIGHGDFDPKLDEGVIALVNETGGSHVLTATQMSRLLTGQSSLRLAVMNSCDGAHGSNRDLFSSTAVTLVGSGIPAVVAMQYEISDEAAVQFGNSFYRAVAQGMPVDAAVTEARIAITMHTSDTAEWGIPVLYMRSPDGRLFDLGPTSGAGEPPLADLAPGRVEVGAAPVTTKPVGTTLRPSDRRSRDLLDRTWTDALEHFWTQNWDEATALLEQVLAEEPDFPGAAAKLDEARRQARLAHLYASAMEASQAGDWSKAVEKFESLVEIDEEYRDAAQRLEAARRQLEVLELYSEARQLSHAEGWEAVISIFGRIRALNVSFDDADQLETTARRQLAERERIRALEKLLNEGISRLEKEQWAEALALFEHLEQKHPNYRMTRELLARARGELQRRDEQERHAIREQQIAEALAAAERAFTRADWAVARRELARVLDLDVSNMRAAEMLAEVGRHEKVASLYATAERLTRARDWQGVVRIFGELHALDGAYPDPSGLEVGARDKLAELARKSAEAETARRQVAQVAVGERHTGSKRSQLFVALAIASAVILVPGLLLFGRTGADSQQVTAGVVTSEPTAIPFNAATETPATEVAFEFAQTALEATPVGTIEVAAAELAGPLPPPSSPPTAVATETPVASPTPTVDQSWSTTAAAIDPVWNTDWPTTISILRSFLDNHPDYVTAQDKLYAAYLFYGEALLAQDQTDDATEQFAHARDLEPDREEAQAALIALTPTPTPVPVLAPAPPPAQKQQQVVKQQPPPPPVRVVAPIPTSPPIFQLP